MIKFEGVSKVFPEGTRAVDDVSFEIFDGECITFVGPSGCGKTTTVKLLNRLVEPTGGHIYLNDQDTAQTDVIALRRSIGYVIQDVGLFPHMTVSQNIALVPRLQGWSERKRNERTEELLNLVGLEPAAFRNRYPHQLSGGQKQRVGVARGLAADPPVILMDEPFGALDPITRAQLQDEFLRLRRRLKKVILFVTHDMDEAIKLGDRIAVMRSGRIVQFDTPRKILREPADPFVRDMVGREGGIKLMKLLRISDIMDPADGMTIPADRLSEAERRMAESGKDILLVVDKEGRFQGTISYEQVMRGDRSGDVALLERALPPAETTDEVGHTLEAMLRNKRVWLPVVGEDQKLRGVVTMTHFACFFTAGDAPSGGTP
ncbi:MAG: ABC transporter ATP-binding protein [Proteobacteria bacterium]|nr:ABC transporter ATP-binding protein [Pseudomonadota bacterium]MBU1966403.1 ABC transporter ATP-binding protein [Pseudomonadota bacterium]